MRAAARRRFAPQSRSVVTASIPEGVIAAGNPARVIRALSDADAQEQSAAAVPLFN
jgi:serine acetyltransferase